MGARAAPAKAAPIPMTPKIALCEAAQGSTSCPKIIPVIAPMNKVGAKTPPDPPKPMV